MNNREKIVVVDLDNTLLGVDSFNLLLSLQFHKYYFRIGLLKILRKIKILNPARFKQYIAKYVYDILSDEEKLGFVDSLSNHIDYELYNSINNKYRNECRIFIFSASLDQYVKPFSEKIGWEGFGSHIDKLSGKYSHLHGDGKLKFLLKYFPSARFTYFYAISDSKSDLPLLKKFEYYDLIQSKLMLLKNTKI